jgi:hypothetical protein
MINRGMAILRYTMVVMTVTAIGVNERGLVQFMRAMFGRTMTKMELLQPRDPWRWNGEGNQSIIMASCR